MSDLVGTPNCWFSHAQAHIKTKDVRTLLKQKHISSVPVIFVWVFCHCNVFVYGICCILNVKYMVIIKTKTNNKKKKKKKKKKAIP